MNHIIFIRGVKDLTDARYFAAMGVDWLSLPVNADPKSFATWHAITDWVQGPQFAVEFDGYDEAVFAKAMIDLKPSGMVVHAGHAFPGYDGVQLFVTTPHPTSTQLHSNMQAIWHLEEDQLLPCARRYPNEHILIETAWNAALIQQLLESGYRGGFCFSATGTSQVGVMDYSEMDQLLELIQDSR